MPSIGSSNAPSKEGMMKRYAILAGVVLWAMRIANILIDLG